MCACKAVGWERGAATSACFSSWDAQVDAAHQGRAVTLGMLVWLEGEGIQLQRLLPAPHVSHPPANCIFGIERTQRTAIRRPRAESATRAQLVPGDGPFLLSHQNPLWTGCFSAKPTPTQALELIRKAARSCSQGIIYSYRTSSCT